MPRSTIAPLSRTPKPKHTARLGFKDAYAEGCLLRTGLIPAVEEEGFWQGCWMGFVAWNWAGDRIWLDKPERQAMRRLLMEGTWPGLIDLQKQIARDELDKRLIREERLYWRGWRP